MIARFRTLLPFFLSVREGDALSPLDLESGGCQIKIYAPLQTDLDLRDVTGLFSIPVNEAVKKLEPMEPPSHTNLISLDEKPTVQANLLQIDFMKSEFDRRLLNATRPEDLETQGDPPIRLCFELANNVLQGLRTITRGSHVRAVTPRSTVWRLDYLNDDGGALVQEEEKHRRRAGGHVRFTATGITSKTWHQVCGLVPHYRPPIWDTLLLDAEALLPELGASIVVAFAALETLISWALNILAQRSGVEQELWKWINDRENWLKEPSLTEQYDQLLRIFTTKSLKDQPELWESFRTLKSIRDTFAHEGKLEFGGREVTVEDAYRLIGRAKEIVNWVESLLPEDQRRPKLEFPVNVKIERLLLGPSGG